MNPRSLSLLARRVAGSPGATARPRPGVRPEGRRGGCRSLVGARAGGRLSRLGLLGLCLLGLGHTGAAEAAVCKVPEMAHPTIQKAVDDAACSEVVLGAQVYSEQVSIGRSGVTVRGAGPGRTILRSPMRRTRSTVTASYLPSFTFVVQVKPDAEATLADLSIDGNGDASCTERYFGLRAHNAGVTLQRIVVENVRGTTANLGCNANVFAVAATADAGRSAALAMEQGTVRGFQAAGVLVYGAGASGSIKNSIVRGVGAQDKVAQTGIWFRNSAAGAVDRTTLSELRFTGDPCKGVGTGLSSYNAGRVFFTANVLRLIDRGIWLRQNRADQVVTENRLVSVLAGILSQGNSAGKVRISKNGIAEVKRSTATTVDTCFAESGDGVAVKSEKSTSLVGNSVAGSARAGIELLAGSDSVEVEQNQATRSSRYDIEDHGTGSRLSLNLCKTSSPAGLCTGKP